MSVIGRDQKGVVARVSTYLASCNINIEDIEQRVMEGLFIMTMLVDLSDADVTLDELVLGLQAIGDEIGMEVTLRLAGEPRSASGSRCWSRKEPHCLEQLIPDRDAGLLNGDLVDGALEPRRPRAARARSTASRSRGRRRPTSRRTRTSCSRGSPR